MHSRCYSGNADTALKAARQLGFKLHSNTWMMAAGLGRIDMLDLIESDCGLWEEGEPLPSRHFILRESYKDGCRLWEAGSSCLAALQRMLF